MPAAQVKPPFDSLARRWRDLADRRLSHFVELYQSGRWRRYYQSEQQFAAQMLDAMRAAKIWARLAGCEPPTVAIPVSTTTGAPEVMPARAVVAIAPKPDGMRPAA